MAKIVKSIRIDQSLVDDLKNLAEKDKRNLNNYIEVILSNHVDNTKKST